MNILKIALLVFVAELPCMVRTVGLQLQSGNIWGVIWGTILGSALALAGGLTIAKLCEYQFALNSSPYLNWVSGAVFILLGLYIMLYGD